MNRLQKKCFVAATGLHLLLALILLIGPGFLPSRSPSDPVPEINFIALKTVDSALSGGGYRDAKPPAAVAEPVKPVVAPTTAVAPVAEPTPKEPPKPAEPVKNETFSPEPAAKPKRQLPDVSTTPVKRSASASAAAKARAAAQAEEAQRQAQAVAAIRSATSGIHENLSGSTEIRLAGPGGGGVPYANFLAAVKKVYTDAWIVPDGITDNSATVAASITIARDGTVVSAKILHRSGAADVDLSVQRTLDRVRYAAPLPDTAEENERTVTINFNVKAKLLG